MYPGRTVDVEKEEGKEAQKLLSELIITGAGCYCLYVISPYPQNIIVIVIILMGNFLHLEMRKVNKSVTLKFCVMFQRRMGLVLYLNCLQYICKI